MAEAEERPGVVARFVAFWQNDRQKWGGMSPGAHARLGLAELRQAFSLGGNVEQQVPLGMWGNPTPGEVAAGRQAGDEQPAADRGSVHGEERQTGKEHLPTPGDIANDRQSGTQPDSGQDRGQEQENDQQRGGRSM